MNRSLLHHRSPLRRLLFAVVAVLAATGATLQFPAWETYSAPDSTGGLSVDLRIPGAITPHPSVPGVLAAGSVRGLSNGSSGRLAEAHGAHRTTPPGPESVAVAAPSAPHAGALPPRLQTHHLSGYRANAPPVTG